MENGIEKELLEEISRRLVVKKEELIKFLGDKVEKPDDVVEVTTKSLYDKGLVTYVTPIGQGCYAITQKGMRKVG